MKKEQLEELLSQLTTDEKLGMIHGNELFATKGVERLGIPPFITSDGPRGVRKDFNPDNWNEIGQSYDYVSYLPCNTALTATWNRELAHQTGQVLGKEARGRGKDMILAPGINIMRTPLCGRSFEYMGEDPYLTSEMVVPLVQGIEENDVSSCVKHFALNNQETRRLDVDVDVDERALREIYLPAFEAAVKRGKAKGLMGAYNKLRGQHFCHNKYLLQDILRKEWGFDGIVMTDWWAKSNYEGHQAEVTAKAPMVAAQNDIYMVVSDAKSNPENDDVEEMLHAGKITVGELQRNAANILGFLLKSPSVLLLTDRICKEELEAMNTKEEDDVDAGSLVSIESDSVTQKIVIDGALLHPAKGKADVIAVTNEFMGDFTMKFTLKSDLGELAQLPVSVFLDNIHKMTVSVQGTNGKWVEESRILNMEFGHNHYIKFYYSADNLEIKEIVLIPNR